MERRDRFLNMLDHTNPQWVIENESYKVIDANEAAAGFWGCTLAEFIGADAYGLVPIAPALGKTLEMIERGYAGSWRCQKKDGTIFVAQIFSHIFTFAGRQCSFVFAKAGNDLDQGR
jgi:hypothetical protein